MTLNCTTTRTNVLPLTTTAIVAVLTEDEPANRLLSTLRHPDFYEDGRAYWLTSDAVVHVDINEMHRVVPALAQDERYQADVKHFEHMSLPNRMGWTRIHPSQYGIEVDSYFDHGRGLEAHDAHGAWVLARKAVLA